MPAKVQFVGAKVARIGDISRNFFRGRREELLPELHSLMCSDRYSAFKMLQTQAIETNHGKAQTKAKLDLTFVTVHSPREAPIGHKVF